MRYFDDNINALNAPDFLEALPDSIALAIGQKLGKRHPFADHMQSSPLRMGAYAAGIVVGGGLSGENQAAVITRGLRSREFGNAVATSLQEIVRRRFDAQAKHRAFVSELEVSRLGDPQPMGAIEFASTLSDVTAGGEYQIGKGQLSDGETIVLHSFGRIVDITRESIINDDKELIASAVTEVGAAAARHEARLVATALERNYELSDGSVAFHADHGNIVADPFADGFSAALPMLRNQKGDDGFAIDVEAAHLVVASDLEYAAVKLVHESGLPIRVMAMAALPVGRYYLLTSRDVVRSIAVARLSGSLHPLAVELTKGAANLDGISLKVRLDVGAGMVGRRGIVRGGS